MFSAVNTYFDGSRQATGPQTGECRLIIDLSQDVDFCKFLMALGLSRRRPEYWPDRAYRILGLLQTAIDYDD